MLLDRQAFHNSNSQSYEHRLISQADNDLGVGVANDFLPAAARRVFVLKFANLPA